MYTTPIRIYYEDTDAGGIVYHANYLKFMERSRCDWLDTLGFSVASLIETDDIMFVVREAQLKYDKPAKLFDQLTVKTRALQVGKVKLIVEQSIYNQTQLLCKGVIKLATLNCSSYTLAPMPTALQHALRVDSAGSLGNPEK
jgi:acyl-CoA thioester hydrolase